MIENFATKYGEQVEDFFHQANETSKFFSFGRVVKRIKLDHGSETNPLLDIPIFCKLAKCRDKESSSIVIHSMNDGSYSLLYSANEDEGNSFTFL